MNGDAIAEVIDDQIDAQGAAVFTVKDGHVIVFTAAVLEKLADAARENGKAVVFVRSGVQA